MKKRYLWCLLFWGLTSISASQELSTRVFPSEDELLEALNLGEIDVSLYAALQEIYLHGIDSSRLHELDGLGFLVYTAGTGPARYARQDIGEAARFFAVAQPQGAVSGYLRHKYYKQLNSESRSKYTTSGLVKIDEHWRADFALGREYSRRERVVSRSVVYQDQSPAQRELIVGNFSRRLGLGAVFGSRRKLLSFSDRLSGESFLCPDFGGYNGLFLAGKRGEVSMQGLVSHNRDLDHSLTSVGGMLTGREGRASPGMIVGLNRIHNRRTGATADDIKLGGNLSLEYKSGRNTAEAVIQTGIANSYAFVDEGRYLTARTRWTYAFWIYGDDFIDISSGSKAGELYRRSTLTEVGFEMSNRHRGQKGCQVESEATLSHRWTMDNSLLVCALNKDSLNIEILWGLTRPVGHGWKVRLDFLGKHKRRRTPASTGDDTTQRPRLEAAYESRRLAVRSHVAYVRRTGVADMLSLFATALAAGRFGNCEISANLGRYNLSAGRVDYFYGFISNGLPLHERLWAVVKLSHSFNHNAVNRHLTVVSANLEATL